MDFTKVPDDLVLQHMKTLQNMLVQMVKDFPQTGDFNHDVEEMKEYIHKWESEADTRQLSYKGIDERLAELNYV